jgi:hypothetical protein
LSTPRFLADENLRHAILVATRRLEPAVEFAAAVGLIGSGASDQAILEFAHLNGWIVVSHDVSTLKRDAEERILGAAGMAGLLLVPQDRPTRKVAESLVLIWSASQAEEWADRIVYLPL